MSLIVHEIFHSIQGESLYSGLPCIFIRLTGCNLRCAYCDTRYAYTDGVEMTIPKILNRIARFDCQLVELTGGEPLLQDETPCLVHALIERQYAVLIETNGSLDINRVDGRSVRIVDFKCPSSNECDKNDFSNIDRLNPKDQVKFVIGNRMDYEYARGLLNPITARLDASHILFSPVHGKMVPATLAMWILKDRLRVRLHLQWHKMIWPNIDRGV